jgi:hypothetical protein
VSIPPTWRRIARSKACSPYAQAVILERNAAVLEQQQAADALVHQVGCQLVGLAAKVVPNVGGRMRDMLQRRGWEVAGPEDLARVQPPAVAQADDAVFALPAQHRAGGGQPRVGRRGTLGQLQ